MAPPSLTTIPPEIFELVLNEIADNQSLWNLCRMNKFLFKRVLPRLYRDVHLRRQRIVTWPDHAEFKDNIRNGLRVLNKDTFFETSTGKILQDQLPDGFGSTTEELKIEDVAVGGSGICETLCCAQYLSTEHISRAAEGFTKVDKIGGFERPGAFRKYRRPNDDHKAYIETFNTLVRDTLASLPNLKRLSLGGVAEWQNKTLDSIKSHNGIKDFELTFHVRMHRYRDSSYEYEDDELDMQWKRATGERYTFDDDLSHVSVSGFRNLTSFKIFNLYGDLSRYVSEIVEVLVENRHTLKEIGFSISEHKLQSLQGYGFGLISYKYDEREEHWEQPADSNWYNIWLKICSRYVRKAKRLTGATDDSYDKLRIESLMLGDGFYMPEHTRMEPDGKDMVALAIELTCIRKIDWVNGVGLNLPEDGDHSRFTDWGRLAPCDNLEVINCYQIDQHLVEDFFEKRAPNAAPIKSFTAFIEGEDEMGHSDYLPYILTKHIAHVELPSLKIKKLKNFHNCTSLEYVKMEIDEDEDEDDEEEEDDDDEEEISDEDKKNPLYYLTNCQNLRTIIICGTFEDLDWKGYVESQINEGVWPKLENITVTTEKYREKNIKTSKIRIDDNGRRYIENELYRSI